MIRTLSSFAEHLQAAFDIATGLAHTLHQNVSRHVEGTRAGHKNSVVVDQLQTATHQSSIGLRAVSQIFLAFDESRWVQDHNVRMMLVGSQSFEHVKSVAMSRDDFAFDVVEFRIDGDLLECGFGCIDANHLAGSGDGGSDAPGSDIAANVDHGFAFDQR